MNPRQCESLDLRHLSPCDVTFERLTPRVLILVLSLKSIQRTFWCVESSDGSANTDEDF
jgi:hypothetical protein